jgi:DNA mismatch repair protein MutS2
VRNASVRFDPHTYAPTYQLDIGSPGQSLAFALARTMHVDESVVARAETLLSSSEREYDKALAELAEERTKTTHQREALDRERGQVAALEENARRRLEAAERERREFANRAEMRLGEALRSFAAELERRSAENGSRTRARVTPGQTGLLARTIDEMRKDLGLNRQAPRTADAGPQAPRPIAIGDRVLVTSLDQEGVVSEDLGANALVTIGSMRTLVPKAELQRRGEAPQPKRSSGAPTLEAASRAHIELDVRGKRFVEAEPEVDRWIDEALLLGQSPLRLIHGKGTGLLGQGLQQFLRAHPHVSGVRYGNANEGGSGVTVFDVG